MKDQHDQRERKSHAPQISAAIIAMISCLLMIFWVYQTTESQNVSFNSEEVYQINGPWQLSINGEDKGTVMLPCKAEARAGDKVVYKIKLEEQAGMCNSLMLRSYHQYVKLYLDGELLLRYGENQRTAVPMSPGSLWQYTRLPTGWEGKELTVELVGYYNESAGTFSTAALGTKAGLIYYVVKEAAPTLILAVPMLILGLAMVVASICFDQRKTVQKIRYLGFFTITAAIWSTLEAHVMQVVAGNTLFAMNLIFILFGLLPVLVLQYLRAYPIFSGSRYMKALQWTALGNYLLINALRVFGLVDYMHSVVLVQLMLVLIMGGILATYIREKHNRRPLDEESRYLFLATLVFSAFGLVDIFNFYRNISTTPSCASSVGLFSFVLILSYSAIKQEARAKTERIEKEIFERLAYTDILTNLKNRTAFEEQMERYRQGGGRWNPIVMMADMNGLKWINDSYGHAMGDQALVTVARLLEKHFGKRGLCYRIGGDEFCVISEDFTDQEFKTAIGAYEQDVASQTVADGEYLSISCGFSRRAGQDMDMALASADSEMYRSKAKQKGNRDRNDGENAPL